LKHVSAVAGRVQRRTVLSVLATATAAACAGCNAVPGSGTTTTTEGRPQMAPNDEHCVDIDESAVGVELRNDAGEPLDVSLTVDTPDGETVVDATLALGTSDGEGDRTATVENVARTQGAYPVTVEARGDRATHEWSVQTSCDTLLVVAEADGSIAFGGLPRY
jgi:hypothetical protein